MGMGLARLELGIWLGMLWMGIGLGMVGYGMVRLGSLLGVATVLLRPVVR